MSFTNSTHKLKLSKQFLKALKKKGQDNVSSLCSIHGEGGQLSLLAITAIISIIIAIILLTSGISILIGSILGIVLSTRLLFIIIISYLEGC